MKVAITGGIGSGKTTLAMIFRELGFPVLSCDEICAELYGEPEFCARVSARMGLSFDGGREARRKLAEKVFADKGELEKLNALLHPAILERLERKAEALPGVVFAEVPLLFETESAGRFDRVVVVMRDADARARAAAARDGVAESDIRLRMKNQFDYENLPKTAHTVLINDGSIEDLHKKAVSLVEDLCGR